MMAAAKAFDKQHDSKNTADRHGCDADLRVGWLAVENQVFLDTSVNSEKVQGSLTLLFGDIFSGLDGGLFLVMLDEVRDPVRERNDEERQEVEPDSNYDPFDELVDQEEERFTACAFLNCIAF